MIRVKIGKAYVEFKDEQAVEEYINRLLTTIEDLQIQVWSLEDETRIRDEFVEGYKSEAEWWKEQYYEERRSW